MAKKGEMVFSIPLGPKKPQPVRGDSECDHLGDCIEARVDVGHMEDSGRWIADVTIKCVRCGVPFRFLGLPGGLSFERPMVSITGEELRAPIEPAPVESLVTEAEHNQPKVFGGE